MTRMDTVIEEYVQSGRCTGCFSCVQACPAGCLSIEESSEGFLQPVLSSKICIGCGKCLRKCHLSLDVPRRKPSGYVVLLKDARLRKVSASGGAFAGFAEYWLESGGVVYGAAFNERWHLSHQRITRKEELAKLQGSKYIQSDLAGVFGRIERDLLDNKRVLFCGTPCQVAGLLAYLNGGHPALLTIDLICHGVPSPGIWRRHVEVLELNKGHIDDVTFRSKPYYETSSYSLTLEIKGKKSRVRAFRDTYYALFLSGISFRESCYVCPYASMKRPGDITLGDCATESDSLDFHPGEALSSVLINTPMGEGFWEKTRCKFHHKALDVKAEAEANEQLHKAFTRPKERDWIYQYLMERGEEGLLEQLGIVESKDNPARVIVRYLVPLKVRLRVKKMLGVIFGR